MAYLTTQAGRPVLALKEGTARIRGRDARNNNIMAARIVAEVIKTTLGPKGMDKMLVDSLGEIAVTNDGAAILKEIDVKHPAAKMMVEVAKTQDDMVGDGTTTAVVLAGELLRKAEELLDQGIHPTVVVSGYRRALETAGKILEDIGIPVDLEDRETLKKIAMTSMASKAVSGAREHLAEIAIDAVKQIAEKREDKVVADIDNVQIVKKEGKSLFDTELVRGIILDNKVIHADMPRRIENAKIALINAFLQVKKTALGLGEFSAEIRIRDPTQVKAFVDQENRMLKDMVETVKKAGANVLLCQKVKIDDVAQHFLAREGIMAVRRVEGAYLEKLAKATGGRVVNNLDDLTAQDLGEAALVEERKIGNDKMIFVEKCKDPRAVCILLRAGLERMADEAERAMKDALSVVRDVMEEPRIVAGGGAAEAEVAKQLRNYALKVGGREQLAIEAFAESMEIVPKTLAENAGHNTIDVLVALRSNHEKAGGQTMGVDVFSGKVVDMYENGVVEPLKVKTQALKCAVEAASTILRIDDIIIAITPKTAMKSLKERKKEVEREELEEKGEVTTKWSV